MKISYISVLLVLSSSAQTKAPASGDWTSYGNNTLGWRYSSLAQINTGNVAKLAPAWIRQTNVPGKFETSPLAFDGMLFFTGYSNNAWALDARTGAVLWRYGKPVPGGLNHCCGPVNRGFAVHKDKLFKVNFEATLVALDAKSGSVLWETNIDDPHKGFTATAAPLVVKDLVIVGVAGAEFGTRGFIDAYDVNTGKRVWRFQTVPAAGEPGGDSWSGNSWQRGGGSTWITGTYDPELNLIYWGTGNPGPDMNGDDRKGDNLYTCSVVALDADTGKLRWHFQFTPHDLHDWDAVADPVLMDMDVKGRHVKALIQANRNGFFYALDRTNGKFLHARAYTTVTWAKSIDSKGRPVLLPGQDPSEEGNRSCPGLGGGHNWEATAYSPQTHLFYFGSVDGCQLFYKTKQDFVEGQWFQASTADAISTEPASGSLIAVDPTTGETRWRFQMVSSPSAGMLATAGGLVFSGDHFGYLIAFDARSGKVVWKFPTGGPVSAPPISYALNGRQYIAVAAGSSMIAFAIPALD